MFDKLAKLPFRLAHKVARRIQDDEDRAAQQRAPSGESARAKKKDRIPEHELADLPTSDLLREASEVLKSLESESGPLLVDVRPTDQRSEAHLPDQEHMPEIEVMIRLAELPADEPVVVYDNDTGSALRVARFLRARGFEQVHALAGGMTAWKDAGGEVLS